MNRSWCNRILEGLHAAGVEDLVVTPGSRSTPLLLAALASPLRLHSMIDERSAAFFALGRARAENAKVALLCTSGSAGAHYLPALLEARYAGHCLIAITADRPPELHDSGANQTIAQRELFAAACPPALDLGAPDGNDRAARRRVQQAVQLATGPIHINVPFRKPLEPLAEERSAFGNAPAPAAIWPAQAHISHAALDHIARRCRDARRGVIVAGPCDGALGSLLLQLARATGFVLLAESTSGARLVGRKSEHRCDAFAHILEVPRLAEELRPDLVLQLGKEPASSALLRWLDTMDAPCVRLCGDQPGNAADGKSEIILGEAAEGIERLLPRLTGLAQDPGYLRDWRRAEERAWAAAGEHVSSDEPGLSEAETTAAILTSLSPQTRLTIGNSLAIRNIDLVSSNEAAELRVLHQRGTSGIEGLIAGAIGASGVGPGALLLGDVSAAHDLSSLSLAGLCRGPLRIMMIDNLGGQIFAQLPIAQQELGDEAMRFWLTPPAVQFDAACAAHSVPYRHVAERGELLAALQWSQAAEGCSFLHIKVRHDSMQKYLRAVREALT